MVGGQGAPKPGPRSIEPGEGPRPPWGEHGCEPPVKRAGCPPRGAHCHGEGPSGGSERSEASTRGRAASQPKGPSPSDSPRRTARGRPVAKRRGERGAETWGPRGNEGGDDDAAARPAGLFRVRAGMDARLHAREIGATGGTERPERRRTAAA